MACHSSVAPGWFVNDMSEVTESLDSVAAYLDDVITFGTDPTAHADPTAHVDRVRALFQPGTK